MATPHAFPSAFPDSRLSTPYATPDADAFNALLLRDVRIDGSDSEDEHGDSSTMDDPAVIVYTDAVKADCAVRCSQWHRACAARLTEVSIAHYGLRPRGASVLAPSLAVNEHIQALDLSDNGLGAEGIASILSALGGTDVSSRPNTRPAPSLRALSLRQNQAGKDGATALAAFLRTSHPLSGLDFAANSIGDKGVAIIAMALETNTSLHILSIEHNAIEDEGAEKLAGALKVNRSLTSLSVEWNAIGPVGGKAIADALAGQPTLSALNLGWNGLGDEGIAAFARALGQAGDESVAAFARASGQACERAIVDIRLHHNRASSIAALPLSRCLCSLKMLDVSGNPLGTGGTATLLLAQQEQRAHSWEDCGGSAPSTVQPQCRLIMEDVCVRPGSALAALFPRAANADQIDNDELRQAGVYAAAQAAAAASKGNGRAQSSRGSRPQSKGRKIRASVRPEIGPPTKQA